MRMNCPGTLPPKVQNTYSTPSASRRVTSFTSRFTTTFAACLRVIGGGTDGAEERMAFSTGSSVAATAHNDAAKQRGKAKNFFIAIVVRVFLFTDVTIANWTEDNFDLRHNLRRLRQGREILSSLLQGWSWYSWRS